jgi:D-serine deaminase-like pyridoxal phosphate-dependent protein
MIQIGDDIGALPTPALVVDINVLERNLDRMSALARKSGVRLRPHGKVHKSPDIARMQIARGAVGVCCQTVAEAEAFADAGITDILLTNQIADRAKAGRLARLALKSVVGACVDSHYQIELLAAAARDCGVRLDIYLEIEVGGGRCGVQSHDEAVALAKAVEKEEELRFAGLQAYNGRAQHIREESARIAVLRETAARTSAFTVALHSAGLGCERITGGGTGSAKVDLDLAWLSELQCGSYALMDADYLSVLHACGASPDGAFAPALFVIASAISVRTPHHVVIDAGLKSMAFDSGPPLVFENANLNYCNASDEHGVLLAAPGLALSTPGDRLWLIPGHCDPTIALHKRLYGVRDGRIEAVWPVIGRGEW